MAQLGLIHADGDGGIIRIARFPHEYAEARDIPGVAATVTVALGAGDNDDKLLDIARNARLYKIVGGVVKKGNVEVVFDPGDDSHAAEKFMRGLTTAQRNGLRAGAKAVVTGLNAGSSDVEKAIGWLVVQRLEDG